MALRQPCPLSLNHAVLVRITPPSSLLQMVSAPAFMSLPASPHATASHGVAVNTAVRVRVRLQPSGRRRTPASRARPRPPTWAQRDRKAASAAAARGEEARGEGEGPSRRWWQRRCKAAAAS